MGNRSLRGRRRRVGRRGLHRDGRGLVAVVGTLLSLLVFLSLFGTFLVFYLPVWMSEDENAFTNGLAQSVATLQSNIQVQTIRGGPAVMASPFTLSSQAVPFLAVPTQGILVFLPNAPGAWANLSIPRFFNGSSGATQTYGPYVNNLNLGTFSVQAPNRYIPGQTFEFENGAVVTSQSDTAQILSFPPLFSVSKVGTNLNVTIMLLNLVGNATRVTSPGTVEVYSHLMGAIQTFRSTSSTAVYLNVSTNYPCAWTNYFAGVRSTGNLTSTQMGITSLDTSKCVSTGGAPRTVQVLLSPPTNHALSTVNVVLATYQIVAGIGQE
jgi:hypothetical protein